MPENTEKKSLWQKLLGAVANPSAGAAPPPKTDTQKAGEIIHDRLDPKKVKSFNNPFKK